MCVDGSLPNRCGRKFAFRGSLWLWFKGSPRRVQHLLCANFAKKKWGCVRVPAAHGASRRHYLSIESSRTSRRLYGVYRNKRGTAGPPRGPPRAQERKRSHGKAPRASFELLYGCALAVWTASTWPPLSLGSRPKGANAVCQLLEARAAIHRYRAMQLTRPALITKCC